MIDFDLGGKFAHFDCIRESGDFYKDSKIIEGRILHWHCPDCKEKYGDALEDECLDCMMGLGESSDSESCICDGCLLAQKDQEIKKLKEELKKEREAHRQVLTSDQQPQPRNPFSQEGLFLSNLVRQVD